MSMINTVTHEGQTYTRTGRTYSHAVITTSNGKPLVEWASTLQLATKNQHGHLARAEKVARTGTLNGWVFSVDYYQPENFESSIIVPVSHG